MALKEDPGDWVAQSQKANPLLFSELDVLLRALDRFFGAESLTASSEDLTAKNFYDELVTVRDVILRILGILEVVSFMIHDHNRFYPVLQLWQRLDDKRFAFRIQICCGFIQNKNLRFVRKNGCNGQFLFFPARHGKRFASGKMAKMFYLMRPMFTLLKMNRIKIV